MSASTGTEFTISRLDTGWKSSLENDIGRYRVVALASGLVALLLMLGRLWWLPAHAPIDVNEGWNAEQAMRALGSGPLYPSPDALTANNYPPLSFYIVGALGHLVGDNIIAGRIVALIGEIFASAAVYAAISRLTCDRRWSWAGLLLFWGFAATFLRHYAVMNDPQWLAEAVMWWALVLVLPTSPGGRSTHRRVAVAAALVVIALLIKHNVVVVPIAVTVWLWHADRKALIVWCAVGAALAFVACGIMFAYWGIAPFQDILGATRSLSLSRMILKGGQDIVVLLPGLAACAGLWRHKERPAGLLPLILLAVAVPIALVQRSGDAINVNATFDAVIALSIAVPVACALTPSGANRRLALAALPILCLVPFAAADNVRQLLDRDDAARRWNEVITLLAAAPEPVACDDQSACYWAGRDARLDMFSLKQRALGGRGEPLRAAIRAQRFCLIELRTGDTSWHTDLVRPLIRSRHNEIYASKGVALLVPASGACRPALESHDRSNRAEATAVNM